VKYLEVFVKFIGKSKWIVCFNETGDNE
jgi:hypothetical protein